MMAATDAQTDALGFTRPQGTDPIRNGDNAISQNAKAAAGLILDLQASATANADAAAAAQSTANTAQDTANSAALAAIQLGHGSPIGRVTASRAGIHYTDLDGTCGAWEWISTGTTNTSWAVIVGDTGRRNIANLIDTASWTVDFAALRRVSDRVSLAFRVTAASELPVGSTLYTMPAGFGPTNYTAFGVASYPRSQIYTLAGYSVLGRIDVYPSDTATIPADARIWGELSFTSISAWPAILPATPYG